MKRRALAALLVLAAAPAGAHHGEPHPTQLAQAAPAPRAHATPAPEQNRHATAADAAGIEDVVGFLNAALGALRARRAGQAIEMLERAESRLLTRSTPAPRAGVPVQQGPVGHIAAARRAAGAADFAAATRETDAALAALERPRRRARGG